MVTLFYLVLVEDRHRQLVSEWVLRDEAGVPVQRGQKFAEPPFGDIDPPSLIASWVQYDPRRDIQEVDVGAVFLEDRPVVMRPGFVHKLAMTGWRQMRPSHEVASPA